MAGPVSVVLLPNELTATQLQEVETTLRVMDKAPRGEGDWRLQVCDTSRIGGNYKGMGRPFGIALYPPTTESDEVELIQIEDAFGFLPQQTMNIYAMCKDAEDHKVLGELTLYFAETYNGIVDFCGALMPPISVKGNFWEMPWSVFDTAFNEWMKPMPGKIYGIEYEVGNGRTWISHYADVEFFRAWLKHKDFHMIK